MEIKINKGYIKTLEDFLNKIKEQYNIDCEKDEKNINEIVLVKNYIIAIEFNKILNYKLFSNNKLNILKINLTANEIESIPSSLNEFTQLKILILNNNKIEKIENIDKLINLEKLELRSNNIKKIEGLKDLINLKYLTLSCNNIAAIENNDLPKMKFLQELGLFGNYIGKENLDNNEEIKSQNKKYLLDFCNILKEKCPALTTIFLGGNYFTMNIDYVTIIKENIPFIKKIDCNNQ